MLRFSGCLDPVGPAKTQPASWPSKSPSDDAKNKKWTPKDNFFTEIQPVSTFPAAQQIGKAYTEYQPADDVFVGMSQVYDSLVANLEAAYDSEIVSTKAGHGDERSWTTRLTWLLGGLFGGSRGKGMPVHQTSIGTGATASDIIWLDETGCHLWNIEAKRCAASVEDLLKAARAEGTNQARRLPTWTKDWRRLSHDQVDNETGLYPFLLSYWSPSLLIVTLCVPCYGKFEVAEYLCRIPH